MASAQSLDTHGADLAADSDGFSLAPVLLQYWQAVVRWRVLIGIIVLACLIAGLVITLLTAPRYTARSQIEISREQKNVTNVEGLESQQDGRDLEFYATQYSLLKAYSLAERVTRKLGLAKSEAFFAAHGGEMAEPVNAGKEAVAEAAKLREEQAIALLLKSVSVEPVRTSRLVDIKYTSRSPELSAQIANVWVGEFIAATMDRQFASTADARRFLEQRLADLRARLEQSERNVVLYAADRDIITLDSVRDADGRTFTQRTLASTELEALNQALTEARSDRIAAESKARSGSAEMSSEVLSNTAITDMRARRAELDAEYANLMTRFKPGYPAARAIKSQIDALDAALARETRRVAGSRDLTYREALAREQALEQQVAMRKGELGRQRQDSIQYSIFQREADTNRQLYDALLQRYKEIGVAGAVGASNIVLVDKAEVPRNPSSPNLPLNMALALLVGLGLAAIMVLALEQIDEGIRSPDDVRRFLGIPLLGNVPMTDSNPLEQLADPKSAMSEAYFSVRSVLAFATTQGLPRILAVTSTQPGEGKSTTALAIAETIGKTGGKVLLIDADLRSPSVHKFSEMPNDAGLSNLLAGSDDFAGTVRETSWRGLAVITSGPIPPSPPELFSSDRFAVILSSLLEHFDHVVIDSPPVLGLADAPLIGQFADGVMFVVEAEETPRRAVRSSLQRLYGVGIHLYGVVVTKIDFSKHTYGYGYGYGYGHQYGYGQKSSPDTETASA